MLNTAKVHEEEFLKKESSVTNPISNICSLIIFLLVLFCFCLFVVFFSLIQRIVICIQQVELRCEENAWQL